MLYRRSFLAAVTGGVFLGRFLPSPGGISAQNPAAGDLVPGQIITIWWPSFLNFNQADVVHRIDGQPVSRRRAPAPQGLVFERMEIPIVPVDGRLKPGRHEFEVEREGTRLRLGGFDVTSYRFGC